MPTKTSITCPNQEGTHQISVTTWGEKTSAPPIICVHGLTRNSRDFDKLAAALAIDTQIICPDIVGRGKSDWVSNQSLYDYAQYAADMTHLINELQLGQVNWIGTSMGGLIGMMMAAMPQSPVKKLIINDVGPYLEAAALDRIANYVGHAPTFASLQEVESYFRHVHAPFAPMTDEDWRAMAEHGAKQSAEGVYHLAYDPKIGDALREGLTGEDVNLWSLWEMISCPTLVLRGEKSDLLSKATATQMTKTGPKADLIEIDHAGHAPSLMSHDQIELVKSWLANPVK